MEIENQLLVVFKNSIMANNEDITQPVQLQETAKRPSLPHDNGCVISASQDNERISTSDDIGEIKGAVIAKVIDYALMSEYSMPSYPGGVVNDKTIECKSNKNCDGDNYEPIWKFTDNPTVMKYKWIRKLRSKIMVDLKRHFGREVKHSRLFSCLCE